MSPRLNWDSPNPSPASECALPPSWTKGWWGSPNSDDCRKSLALCLLCTFSTHQEVHCHPQQTLRRFHRRSAYYSQLHSDGNFLRRIGLYPRIWCGDQGLGKNGLITFWLSSQRNYQQVALKTISIQWLLIKTSEQQFNADLVLILIILDHKTSSHQTVSHVFRSQYLKKEKFKSKTRKRFHKGRPKVYTDIFTTYAGKALLSGNYSPNTNNRQCRHSFHS